MATIRQAIDIGVAPAAAWAALRDFGHVHERLAQGFVTGCTADGDTREVTFANGAVVREVLVSVEDDERRLVYSVVQSALGATHHNAAAQVLDGPGGATRFVWVTDVLPHELAEPIGAMMALGIEAIRATLEGRALSASC